MTEPREPRPPEDGEPHGLREEIRQEIAEVRHEIEEAVEHVPKPIRWTVGKLVLLVVFSLVGLVILALLTAVLYVSNRTQWAAQELALILNQTLVARSDVALEIGDLKGNPFVGVRIVHPTVRFREGAAPPLIEAPSMRLRYSAWGLLTGGRGPIVVDLDQPVFQLGRKADGTLRLPTWKSGPARPGRARTLDVVVRIHDGRLVTPDTTARIDGLELDALATVGRQTSLDVRSLRWREGPFGSVLERCVLNVAGGDSTRITLKELRTRDLELTARAAWPAGKKDALVHLDVARIRWRWLARVFRNRTFDVTGEGRTTIDARGWDAWRGRFRIRADWDSLPLEARGGLAWDGKRLRLDPLVGQSAAGDVDGLVLWSREGWEISAAARRADPSRWQVLGLRDWPAGDLNGRFRYWVDTRAVPHARLSARLAGSEWAHWRADSGVVNVDFVPVGPDTFTVLALRRGGTMTLHASTTETGWRGDYTIDRFPLDEWPDGRSSGLRGTLARGAGVAESRQGALIVNGTLDGALTDWLGIHTARWRLSDLQGALLPVPDLTANARLTDLFFLGVHWDSAGARFKLGDATVALPGLTASAGDTVLSLDARVDWGTQGWRLAADRAEVTSRQFHWTADPPLQLAGDPHGVDFQRLIASDGPARLEMSGRWAGPGGRYDWTARASELDLGRLGFPPEWKLAGAASGTLTVTGVPGDPRWEVRAGARGPGMQGHRADSLSIHADGGPSRLELTELSTRLDGGTATARGAFAGMARAWPDTLTLTGILDWLGGASSWNGMVRADHLPLDHLGSLAKAASGWKGRVNGAVELAGNPRAPDLTWNLEASPLAWGDYQIDAATGHGRYHDRRLEVPELKMTRGGVVSTIHGSMPLELAVGRRPQVPDTPMEWTIAIPNGDLAVVPVFVPQIGSASGKLDLNAHLAGTMKHPDLSGRARIREGRVRMAGREEVLESVSADLTLDETRITLDSLSARQRLRKGVTGTVRGDGFVNLTGLALKNYEFHLDVNDFTALESGTYVAAFDGKFKVTNGPRIAGSTLPHVESVGPGVELRRAVVLFDFANQSEVEQVAAATRPLYWTYRIHLSATDKLYWQPPDANIEFSADLTIEQTRDQLIIFGDMSALRGTYYYLNNKFTIDRADLTFENTGDVDPKLDIEAVTQVPRNFGQQPTGVGSAPVTGNEDITATITGRAKEAAISFSASPDPWDQPTILSAITLAPATGGAKVTEAQYGSQAKDYADSYFTRTINRQLSADVSRAFQGYLNELELERESGGLFQSDKGDVIVRLGVPLSRNVSVRYGQRLPGTGRTGTTTTSTTTNPFERDIEAEYRINRFFYITSELTQRRVSTAPSASIAPPEFNVNLKARWEY